MPRPICFMVMPFGKKPVPPRAEKGPAEIDFDALWTKAFEPMLVKLGYEPVRADQDLGALIIHEMIERLYFSDVVMADMTIPNGNVYYEVGLRHASRDMGCVLVAADWATALFDVNQMRRLPYPLPEGVITDETATAIRHRIEDKIVEMARGQSPIFQTLPGFPDATKIDVNRASSIKAQLTSLSAFQARLREAQRHPDKTEKRRLALAVRDEHPPAGNVAQSIALQIVMLLRDVVGWQEMLDYAEALPSPLRDIELVQEQRVLALSKLGDHVKAIAMLEELIARHGDTSERQGLLGGRYKALAKAQKEAKNEDEYRRSLDRAISHYDRGMRLDLNDYYPSCNLPRLYRERAASDDKENAVAAARVALLACERAKLRNPADEWIRPTLLGMAFDAADVKAATALLKEVRSEGAAKWKLETTISDIETSLDHVKSETKREKLAELVKELKKLL